MYIFLSLLGLTVGFVLLVKGADWFVDGAAGIATKFGIPQLVIGLTIVAMGTSAPEAAVSLTAAFNGAADITIGNIVGSNILNIFIILGITSVICPLIVQKSTLVVDIPVVILSSILLFVLGLDETISRLDGIIMLVVFAAYIGYLMWTTKKSKTQQLEPVEEEAETKPLTLGKSILFLVVGLVMVVFGSHFVVEAAKYIAQRAGLSERFIGLTIVALGTSLPELFTSVTAALKKNSDIAIGNIVGSNLFNILFVVGLSGLVIPVPYGPAFNFDTIVSLVAAIALLLFCLPKKRLTRWAGAIMLVAYAAYFVKIFWFNDIQWFYF